ncbi:hypothetical protein [Actinoalloteichus sp. AHMU CJ021]|uniref:hypothetical protein n=1 Tax=Actinoalloteichus sp. AHMU CJ021 TaxID=2072503 RepID=UPI00307C168B
MSSAAQLHLTADLVQGPESRIDPDGACGRLAVRGSPVVEATARLTTAAAEHTDAAARSRVISQIKLASLTMANGDPTEATAMGREALDGAAAIRSRRAGDDLRELWRYAARHPTVPEVTGLRQRITTLILPAST